jgi:hypothetical protein
MTLTVSIKAAFAAGQSSATSPLPWDPGRQRASSDNRREKWVRLSGGIPAVRESINRTIERFGSQWERSLAIGYPHYTWRIVLARSRFLSNGETRPPMLVRCRKSCWDYSRAQECSLTGLCPGLSKMGEHDERSSGPN